MANVKVKSSLMKQLEIYRIDKGMINDDFIHNRVTLKVKYVNSDVVDLFRWYGDGTIKFFSPNSSIELGVNEILLIKILTYIKTRM